MSNFLLFYTNRTWCTITTQQLAAINLPIVTLEPIVVGFGDPGGSALFATCTTALSWIFVSLPTVMLCTSPTEGSGHNLLQQRTKRISCIPLRLETIVLSNTARVFRNSQCNWCQWWWMEIHQSFSDRMKNFWIIDVLWFLQCALIVN